MDADEEIIPDDIEIPPSAIASIDQVDAFEREHGAWADELWDETSSSVEDPVDEVFPAAAGKTLEDLLIEGRDMTDEDFETPDSGKFM